MLSFKVAIAAALAALVFADSHYFYMGYFSEGTISGLEFDDVASTITLKQSSAASNSTPNSKWIALDAKKKTIYVATTDYFQSFAIAENKTVTFQSQLAISSGANTSISCTNGNFIDTSPISPYTVYGTAYSTGCPTNVISVDDNGALVSSIADLGYNSTSGVHGTDVDSANSFIYSADDQGNAVWSHAYNSTSNTVELLQYLAAPEGSDPRHLAVHPNGGWVYVVYEANNSIAVYKRDNDTGLLTDMATTYPLLPSSYTNSSSYWADEVLFSVPTSSASQDSPKYLLAATRSRSTNATGFISAFSLDADTGAISKQLFLTPSTASGGPANAVSPAPFGEEYFAITDSSANTVEVWKISDDETGAAKVAGLSLDAGPANVVWMN